MKTNDYPTAVYLQDGDVFRFIMVENSIKPVTVGPGESLKRVIDEIGMLSMHDYPNLDAIVKNGEKVNIKALRSTVKDISAEDLSDTLFAILRLNFKLLDLSAPHTLFSPQDRQEMLDMGFNMIYVEQNGFVKESAYYSVYTTRGWARFLVRCAEYYSIESYSTASDVSRILDDEDLQQYTKWIVKVSNVAEARMVHQWDNKLKKIEPNEHILLAKLHEGEDRKNIGYKPLMAFVRFEGTPLTCFADWKFDSFLKGRTAHDFNNRLMFIRVHPPQYVSGRRVGKFSIVPNDEVKNLLGMV